VKPGLYRVIRAMSIPMFKGPNANFQSPGYLKQNELLFVLSSDENIQTHDDLHHATWFWVLIMNSIGTCGWIVGRYYLGGSGLNIEEVRRA
jgi:hypothetical protein